MAGTTSADGTLISYDRTGTGPALILVLGAFNDRGAGAALAERLSSDFTVYNYDRRGRGRSGDAPGSGVDQEIDDLSALLAEAGGNALVFGYSSGAVLALRAAARGLPITRLAVYDPPFLVNGSTPAYWTALADRIDALVADDRRGDAVELYQTRGVGMPEEVVVQLRGAPFRPALEAMAHTLAYDARALASPADLPATVSIPTLVLHGVDGPPVLSGATQAVAQALPNGEYLGLVGQTHDLVPEVLGPVLCDFYGGALTAGQRGRLT
ncbi:Lysophospholipase, alpha-beta hydrolase superfamily [Nakamurella panacisegetis]|uniref:Lysophospholipase, alpha-beta hydrolase superfamily n=1 Tax=Nakamurella panacisegetis TaxID=1090615 RepID=A0A1H0LTR6_9ACTN|nr:alpha/beta hydrolase [Nakamurella panacisegetis]SDO71441.1 Lysophospholipase, alpha-beta hydrolase superfamily [Nakamurella panacisegetis]